jgi:hypothetical protein
MPILGIMASAMSANLWQPEGAYDSLATVTLSAATASIEFAGIPSTYKHLQIRGIGRSTQTPDTSVNVYLRLNSDSGSNYSTHYLTGNGSSASSGSATSTTFIYTGAVTAAGSTASIFESSVIDILDYANTNKYKTVRTLAGWDANGSGLVSFWSGSWRNTNATTTITLLPNLGNWAQYSQFALYGIK